jgi:pSer/pThr/pTyr-binding forkhead associated (FHA) protein
MHAEVWEHDGKIFIKDVKSSNGTFINGDRLSAEGLESEPFELKSEDMVVRFPYGILPFSARCLNMRYILIGIRYRYYQRG